MIGKEVAPPSRGSGGTVGESRQPDNDTTDREAPGGFRNQLRRRGHAVIGDHFERRHNPRVVVADCKTDATSSRINSKITHGPL